MARSEGPKKERRGAQRAHKVKTGCLTCKIRHKKCDEKKPTCSQCHSTGRKCDFECSLEPFRPLSYPGCLKAWSLAGQLWTTPPLHLIDVWYFEYFRVVCTKELSLSLETDLWESFVLPAALTEPCIMHGVLALSALRRDMVPKRLSRGLMSLTGYSASYSLRRYNQAIRELNASLGVSHRSRELALVGSLIFILVETYQGRDSVAQMHLQNALAILKNPGCSTSEESEGLRDLARLFDSITSPSRADSKSLLSVIHHMPIAIQVSQDVLAFRSISEARDSLNSITGAIHSLCRRGLVEAQSSLRPHPPLSLREDISTLSHQLDLWHSHFAALRAHSMADVETASCVQVLLIHYQIAKLYLLSEPEHQIYAPQFSNIVELSASILRAEEGSRMITTQPKPGHSLDTATIQPLFYTACRCKDGMVRRRAIELLETMNGVSLYDTRLLARVGKWVVAMEEKVEFECGNPVNSIGEEDMLYDIELEVGSEAGRCDITAWRRVSGLWLKVSGYVYAS
ncbi:hypothetical protein F5Y09DRAFT_97847 [Xylaria sp. FL1042]|nr:hypothetical protein F5Y09DRAFT_97847 [Xylaria sp. FL1042]